MSEQEQQKIEQIYEVYVKHSFQIDPFPIMPFYKKDKDLNGKSLEEITNFLDRIQYQKMVGDCYDKLINLKERNGNLIYKFEVIPGHKSIAVEENFAPSYISYKIKPKLKLKQK